MEGETAGHFDLHYAAALCSIEREGERGRREWG